MKLKKLTGANDSGLLLTWSRGAIATALVWLELAIKIGLTLLIARLLRWLITPYL